MTSVAFHIDQIFASAPGGIGTYIRELVPALASVDSGLDVTLFHTDIGLARSSEPWMQPFPIDHVPGSIRRLYPRWLLANRPALPPELATLDLLHAPSPASVPPPGLGQRLIVTVHDLAPRIYPSLFPPVWRALYRFGTAQAARRADALITVSENTAKDLARFTHADPKRIHVVPLAATIRSANGDTDRVLERLKIPDPFVLFVGTLEPRKNLVRLIRAYRRAVTAAGLPHTLVLAGPLGWRTERLLRELRSEGPGEIVLTGMTASEDLDALYRRAAVFVYPSLYEGFGLPVLEAMARGVPTIVSSTSSLPEVAGDAALMVEPRSVREIADAIEHVLTDADRSAVLSASARARAEQFSWERTARLTLRVYERVLN
ncbi:MAG: glycosyltransferase family 4 protein [Actinomycetota bacterium]